MYYYIECVHLLWVALVKKTPFFDKDGIYIPGEQWYTTGDTLDEVMNELKVYFPLCKDWTPWVGEKILGELVEAHKTYIKSLME